MSEAITRTESYSKSKSAKQAAAFEFPSFEMPKFEVPEGMREMGAQWVTQSRETFERGICAAEEISRIFGNTCSTATKCSADCTAKVNEMMRQNTMAAFDFVRDIMGARSLPEAIEISMTDARKQYDAMAAQTQDILSTAQKAMTETTNAITKDMPKVFQPSAAA